MGSFSYIHLDLNLTYVILFLVLGLFTFFVHVPSEDPMLDGYRKSRKTLGTAFFLMTVYCIMRSMHPQYLDDYGDFWLLTVVSLMFSWLNYTAFLFLIKTEHTIRKHFIIDGLIPIVLMFVVGILGQIWHQHLGVLKIILGVVFIAKSVRMFYVCDREWRHVNKEQQDYYDEELDITWMRVLVWLTFMLSLCTLIAFYLPAIHMFYCYVAPLVFVFMVFKMVNYLPGKIARMRSANEEPKPKSTTKSNNLEDKIGMLVERWVQEKRYCAAELSITEVATQMGTNKNYLSQYLNNSLEVTFQVWLNTLRIEESKRILTTENITIEEVGAKVGIPQSYNFSRWFKAITGTTPFKYRKEENRSRG